MWLSVMQILPALVTDELTADQMFWYFNVMKVGAGYPYCSHSFHLYLWIMVGGRGGFVNQGWERLCFRLSLIYWCICRLSSLRLCLWGGFNVYRECFGLWNVHQRRALAPYFYNKNVLLGTVLSAPPNNVLFWYCRLQGHLLWLFVFKTPRAQAGYQTFIERFCS